MGYRVKTVSAITGIPRGTLLAWERRYRILEPDRSASGYREYTEADVALFKRLKALVDAGYSISEAVDIARAAPAPQEAVSVSAEPRGDVGFVERPVVRAPVGQEPDDIVGAVLRSLLAFDRASADRLVPRLGQVSFNVAIDDLFVPVLHRLGEMWERGEVTVAQEHFVSGFCREQLLAMYHGVGGGPEHGMTVACATPPGERHELGLLVLALKLALAGHRVVWLGADLPVPDLCAYLAAHRPRFVCLSFTRAVSRETVVNFAKAVRAGAPPMTEIVLGGPGLAGIDGLLVEGVQAVGSFAALEVLLASSAKDAWRGRPGGGGGGERASG